MEQTPNKITGSKNPKATIPQISKALSDLFNDKNIESKEMIEYIKEVYQLIDSINSKAPDGVKQQLLLWPRTDESVLYFIDKIKDIRGLKDISENDSIYKILNKYEELFERWGEWCVKKWKEIVSHYNPDRVNQMIN